MMIALVFDVLKYVFTALVLLFIVNMVVRAYLKNEELKRASARNPEKDQIMLPLKLQAYERLILFLERMAPAQVVYRSLQAGISAKLLQMALLQVIREEFDHNVAQQIYISTPGWALTKTAKEEVILLINKTASELGPDATGHELAKNILENWVQLDENPVQAAIDRLKSEVEALL
jgi:hypothetical protein